VSQRCLSNLALHHQQQTCGSGLNRLVTEEHQAKSMFRL
jgi:hypothetical protein